MNIRLLIVVFLILFLSSCSTISETTSYDYKNLSINGISDSINDDQFENILSPYKDEMDEKLSEVIAFCGEGLTSYRPESPLSNFLSDMILEHAKEYCIENSLNFIPNISLFNHGGIRASLPKGEVKISNAYELMPFENKLVMLLLTGEQVVSLADYISTRGGEGVSGITFGMLKNKAVDIKVQGLKVDVKKNYWLVTSDYIANGGDGMKVLTWCGDRVDTEDKIRDIIIQHLKVMRDRGEIIHATSDGRIYNVN